MLRLLLCLFCLIALGCGAAESSAPQPFDVADEATRYDQIVEARTAAIMSDPNLTAEQKKQKVAAVEKLAQGQINTAINVQQPSSPDP